MSKNGRNDPCPCGSGKKYKKCCINKEQQPVKNTKSHVPINIPGLWKDELLPENQYYSSMDEFYDEVRTTGRVPYVIYENVDDDEELGHMHSIEVEELCRHGNPSSESVTFNETDDGRWENVASGFGMASPCILCEMLKEGIEIGCPGCGKPLPDFSEKEILEIYENDIAPLDITCPNCGSKFITRDEKGFKAYPPKNTEE